MEKEIMSEELEVMTAEEVTDLAFPKMELPDIQEVEKRTAQYLSYLRSAMKVTRVQDWNFFDRQTTDGRRWKLYRLSQFAAKRLRIPLGVSITNVKREILILEDERGPFSLYIYSGIASWGKMEIYVEGRASIRDKFFAFTRADGWKPLSEVKQLDIITAAYNNLIKKAVIDTFGLGDFTAEDLRQLGFDPMKIGKGHEFENKPAPPSQNGKPAASGLATEKQIKMIFAKGHSMGWDEDATRKFIQDRTGKPSAKDLTYLDINKLLAEYEEKGL